MSQPERKIKDSVLSTVTVDDFSEETLDDFDDGLDLRLSNAAGLEWWFNLDKMTEDGVDYLGTYVKYSQSTNEQLKNVHVIYQYSVRNQNPDDTCYCLITGPRDMRPDRFHGTKMFFRMDDLLEEDSGFLVNGTLTVHVEVRVLFVTTSGGIRRFNFSDPFDGCVRFKQLDSEETFYVKKEIVMRASCLLAEQIAAGEEEFLFFDAEDGAGDNFHLFLQLLHGVNEPVFDPMAIFQYATQFEMHNVLLRLDSCGGNHVNSRFTHIDLKRVLKTVKSVEELKEETVRHEQLDSEMVKAIVRKFFSFAVDFRRP